MGASNRQFMKFAQFRARQPHSTAGISTRASGVYQLHLLYGFPLPAHSGCSACIETGILPSTFIRPAIAYLLILALTHKTPNTGNATTRTINPAGSPTQR